MFYRMDRGGCVDSDVGIPPLTVVLRHARDGEPEVTTQVSACHRSTVVVPNLGEVSIQLEVRHAPSGPWQVRINSQLGDLVNRRDFFVPPMTDADRELELKDRPRGGMSVSVEAFLSSHFSGLREHLEDDYHGHPV